MNRLFALLAVVFLALIPVEARATNILSITPTAAQSAQLGPIFNFSDRAPPALTLQCNFTYGSGGTSADAYVQSTLDNGATWTDIANFHFTQSSARFIYNLADATPVTTEYVPTDGSLTANSAKDGILGQALRVKWTTVGVYVSTTLSCDTDAVNFK